jgi:hypothetical protein
MDACLPLLGKRQAIEDDRLCDWRGLAGVVVTLWSAERRGESLR